MKARKIRLRTYGNFQTIFYQKSVINKYFYYDSSVS